MIAHFPFGLPEREIQYGYYAFLNHRRILNGYSGSFPISYRLRVPTLRLPLADLQIHHRGARRRWRHARRGTCRSLV